MKIAIALRQELGEPETDLARTAASEIDGWAKVHSSPEPFGQKWIRTTEPVLTRTEFCDPTSPADTSFWAGPDGNYLTKILVFEATVRRRA